VRQDPLAAAAEEIRVKLKVVVPRRTGARTRRVAAITGSLAVAGHAAPAWLARILRHGVAA